MAGDKFSAGEYSSHTAAKPPSPSIPVSPRWKISMNMAAWLAIPIPIEANINRWRYQGSFPFQGMSRHSFAPSPNQIGSLSARQAQIEDQSIDFEKSIKFETFADIRPDVLSATP
jgi:hypothetical protein